MNREANPPALPQLPPVAYQVEAQNAPLPADDDRTADATDLPDEQVSQVPVGEDQPPLPARADHLSVTRPDSQSQLPCEVETSASGSGINGRSVAFSADCPPQPPHCLLNPSQTVVTAGIWLPPALRQLRAVHPLAQLHPPQ